MKRVIFLLIMLVAPALGQDNSTPIGFDPGPITFTNDPIPDGPPAGTNIYPIVPDTQVMNRASVDVNIAYDGWMNGALTWLGMNTSLPANVTRDNLSLQAA